MYRRYTPYRHYYRHIYRRYPRYRRLYRRYYPRKHLRRYYTEKDQKEAYQGSSSMSVLDALRLMFMEGMGR
ncbi:MAG: hypothetical protein JHC26_05570 [Thermofilum sp.]|nr:hypothetical protein [Thermofilum sp.]